jgi:pectate lyase C
MDAANASEDADGAQPAPERDDASTATVDAGEQDMDAGARGDGAALDAAHGDAPDAAASGDGAPATHGDGGVLHQTIVVKAGETFDGQGQRFSAGPELGDGSQSETQKPLFKLEDGASLRNVVLGSPAADGVHCHGDVQLENIVWEDIGEDALTIKESGTVVLRGGSASNGDDKVFQINAPSTFRVSDFKAAHAGKFIRQNGGTTFKIEVYIERCDISDMKESIFRTDSTTSTVNMTDTRYSAIGKTLFMGVMPANVTSSGNVAY